MKNQYKNLFIGVMAAGALSLGSCANHDLIPDIAEIGQVVPTVYWEVGSTVCKAGESFTFQGKYTVEPGKTPDRSEVWYLITREDVATASAKLAGGSLSYSQTVNATDTMRSMQSMAVFPHELANWDGHEFIITGTVPVSRTLTPVSWADATEWDADKFATYYPQGFKEEFLDKVIGYLTDDATANSYYNALRNVYLNYNFTNEQFAAVGLPQLNLSGDDQGAGAKSDAWHYTSVADETKIVGYYYITLDADGETVYNEVAKDYQPAEGQVIYPVYESCAWVFSRYDDNAGAVVNTVRPEYLPKFKELISQIPFEAWIYDSANRVYKVDFSRKYALQAEFRAYDTEGNEGITSKTDRKAITIN